MHPQRERGGRYQGGQSRPQKPKASWRYPDKKFAALNLEDQQSTVREVKLITNAYSIITANKDFIIHEYDLLIEPSPSCKDLPPKVLSRTYVSRSLRQLIMTNLIPNLVGLQGPVGNVIIGPLLETIYSTQPLFHRDTQASSRSGEEFKFNNVNVSTDLISHLKVDIVIRFNRTYKVSPNCYNGSFQSAIMHHQLMIKMPKYGSVYYPMNDTPSQSSQSRLDLISRHLMGISISGARKNINNQLTVVINCSHSYITHSFPLTSLLASFLAERPVEEFESQQILRNIPQLATSRGSEDWFASFCSILNGFKCRAITPTGTFVNLRFELTNEPARALYMNETTTLLDYYEQLGTPINYPDLPCLKSRSTSHPFYPMEVCNLLPGQKVPIFRLSTAARNHLILMHKPHPNVTNSTSSKARHEVMTINKAQFRSFGVQLSKDPIETIGRTLKKPSLQYRNQMIDPVRDYWESSTFYQSINLIENWSVVDTVGLAADMLTPFLMGFIEYSLKFGLQITPPSRHFKPKQEILAQRNSIESLINMCNKATPKDLRFVMFVIDSTSTQLNRMIHLAVDDHPRVTATCVRSDSILNHKQRRSIYRTFVHKLNTRLGGTNYTYNNTTMDQLNIDPKELMVVGLDVTHPDNELSGVSIVGCAYTYCKDLFRHKSLVWPQTARKEIITKMDSLVERLINEYSNENSGNLPKQIIIYRDGVSNEEFERVRLHEITKAKQVIEHISINKKQQKPNLSYIIAQKRHTMRFFQKSTGGGVQNPPGGTLIDHAAVTLDEREFYLYSNTSPQATARPLHYHVLLNGLGLENLQKLTYYLCFNFGKCSSSLSMPSCLRYAHNAAYDARNRVIASKEFSENKFYTTKFFC